MVTCASDCTGSAGLSVESPLKAALTGLELVLARAQIWEESAAKHVSLGSQLEGVAGLATRWRRLELSAWRNLLKTTQHRHAAGMLAPIAPIALSALVCTERKESLSWQAWVMGVPVWSILTTIYTVEDSKRSPKAWGGGGFKGWGGGGGGGAVHTGG